MGNEASVSLRLKIVEEGLSNLTALLDGLKSNDAAAQALREEAAALAAEITRLKTASDAESQASEALGQQLADAQRKLAAATSAAEGLSLAQHDAGAAATAQRQATEGAAQAVGEQSAATERAIQTQRQQESALASAEKAAQALGSQLDKISAAERENVTAVDAFNAELKKLAREGGQAPAGLEQAFRQLGIGAVNQTEAEVHKLQIALAQIRNDPDVLGADKRAAVTAFNQKLAELRGEASKDSAALQDLGHASTDAGVDLASAARQAAAWIGAMSALNQLKTITMQVVNTGSEFETLRLRLENLLGSTEKASAAFDMIKRLAMDTPFEVSDMTQAFIKLTAFGLQPTEQQMRSLSDVASNLGGGSESLSRITLALGQAWAKTKLQGDDIMQMAEAGVPVWDALAKATGRTVPELQRMSEAGLLGRDVISKLIDELGRMNAGASDKLMNTYAGAVSNAKDALAEFFDMVARDGVLDWFKKKLQELMAEFDRMKKSGELETKAKQIADAFLTLATAAETVAKGLVSLGPQLEFIAKAMIGLKAIDIVATLSKTSVALMGIGTSSKVAAEGVAVAGASATTTAVQMETAAVAGGRLATVLRLVRSLTGIGLAIGVTELAMEFFRAKRAAEEGDAAVKEFLKPTPINGPKKAADDATKSIQATVDKSDDLLKEFDNVIEKGGKTGDALAEIGKKFDLSNAPGIKDAASVLDRLLAQGKITATQFRDQWNTSLKDINLLEFEARSRQAMSGAADDAKRLQAALDAGVRESIRRAGGDFDVLSGGMGKAAQSAIGDVELIIGNLDRLRSQGVNVGTALSLSLGKSINTADGQSAIQAVQTRIEAVRKVLGDKIADGLLQQAKDKANELQDALDKVKPGINSLREAFQELGLKSREELASTAKRAQDAYNTIMQAGQQEGESYTAWQLRKQAATQAFLEKQIASQGGVATEADKTKAAMSGLEIQTDATGKALVRAMQNGQSAAAELGNQVQLTTEQLKAQKAALDAINDKYSRPGDGKNNSVLGSSDPTSDDNTGLSSLEAKKKSGTLSASDLATAQAVYQAAVTNYQVMQANMSAYSVEGVKSTQDAYIKARAILDAVNSLGTASKTTSPTSSSQENTTSSNTNTVDWNINGKSYKVEVTSKDAAQTLLSAIAAAKSAAGY